MVGGLGALVNLATVTLFQILKFGPMISITGGIAISVVHNFFWHRELTFRDSKTKEIYRQFMMFVTFSLAGLSVNFLVAQVLVLQFVLCQDWPQLAAACGILAGLVINFVTSRYIVFKP